MCSEFARTVYAADYQGAPSANRVVDEFMKSLEEAEGNDSTLDNEDVIVSGDWQDYTGSESVMQGDVRNGCLSNKLWGTRAWVEGAKTKELTERGNPVKTFRTRRRLVYHDFRL